MGNQITSEEKNKEGFSSSLIREAPPCHFRFKIESFSSFSALPLERYESCEFNAGDYKWRLAFYPNGNKKGDGQNHISMCLVLDKTCNNNLNKEISVTFNFLAYDQIRDKYLSVPGVGRFHSMKSELSIDKFIPLWMFNDPSYGFLVQDSCMFGADVFVVDSAASTGQCLSMTRVKPVPLKYRWTIQKFSGLEDKCYYSDKFRIGDHDWKIALYPKGYVGNNISLYLHLVNEKTLLAAGGMVYAEFKLRVIDQVNAKHFEKSYICCSFIASQTSSGSLCFLNASKLNKSTGYLVNDTCILEAEVIVVGSAKNWI